MKLGKWSFLCIKQRLKINPTGEARWLLFWSCFVSITKLIFKTKQASLRQELSKPVILTIEKNCMFLCRYQLGPLGSWWAFCCPSCPCGCLYLNGNGEKHWCKVWTSRSYWWSEQVLVHSKKLQTLVKFTLSHHNLFIYIEKQCVIW